MDALTLLAEARGAGLHLRAEGDQLIVEGPKAAAPVVAKLREHKAEVLSALACCPACVRRAGSPSWIDDGCELHHVAPEDVARWWQVAQERDAEVSVCHCCGGPAKSEAIACKRCEEGQP